MRARAPRFAALVSLVATFALRLPAAPPAPTPSSAAKCAGVIVDLTKDAKNCGTCGRDCLGKACVAGLCAPELVASATDVTSIVVDGAEVWWTSSAGVFFAPKSGGAATLRHATKSTGAFALVLDAVHAYWRDKDGAVWSGPRAGTGKPVAIAPPTASATNVDGGLAFDGHDLYWAESMEIRKVPSTGGTPSKVLGTSISITTGGFTQVLTARSIVAHGAAIEWLQGSIQRYGTKGSTKGKHDDIGSDRSACGVIAAQGDEIALFDPREQPVLIIYSLVDGSDVAHGPKGPWSTPPTKTVPCESVALALDGNRAFVTLPGGVYGVRRTGGGETMLASASTGAALALDAKYVYFPDQLGIVRVAK